MRNLFVFYLLIVTPFAALIIFGKRHMISPGLFFGLLFFWAFVYHPLICGLRLLAHKKITPSQFPLNFIPFWNEKFFWFLFFNVNLKTSKPA